MKKLLICCGFVVAVFITALFAPTAQEQELDSVAQALKSLDDYMAAFNARDEAAWADTLNYPHVRIAGGEVRVWQTKQEYMDAFDFDSFAERAGGWSRSEWDKKEVIQASKDKVHVAVQFSRYDKDNKKVSTYESFYVLTNKDGHWGTLARSSFAP